MRSISAPFLKFAIQVNAMENITYSELEALDLKKEFVQLMMKALEEGKPFLVTQDGRLFLPHGTSLTDTHVQKLVSYEFNLFGFTCAAISFVDESLIVDRLGEIKGAHKSVSSEDGFDQKDSRRNLNKIISAGIKLGATDVHIMVTKDGQNDIAYRVHTKISKKRPVKLSSDEIIKALSRAYNWEGASNSNLEFDLVNIAGTTLDLVVNVDGSDIPVQLRFEKGATWQKDTVKCAIRITHIKKNRDLDELGVSPGIKKLFIDTVRKPSGIVIISGPTGSGKTSMLHGMLHHIPEHVIVETVEDPVETVASYNKLIAQNNLDAKEGYIGQLRSMMRKDPDLIVVGEMRDADVVNFVFNTSLTGHLVITTFHTNDAIGILTRMRDMGLSPADMSIKGVISLLIATRIAPVLCDKCKLPLSSDEEKLNAVRSSSHFSKHIDDIYLVNADGCDNCKDGIAGVKPVVEVIVVNSKVRKYIADWDLDGMMVYLSSIGWKSLPELARQLVINGTLDPMDADSIFDSVINDTDNVECDYQSLYEGV